jgi:alpha/beta superfamily hydrolase
VVQQRNVSIQSGDLELEGVYCTPSGVTPSGAAVVCHPHPQYGGDMHNLVVTVIVRGLIEAGFGALAFNFRGVGESHGHFDNGQGERDDVRAALAFARALPGVEQVALAGYSFGAAMAAASADDAVTRLALVGLPARMVARDGTGLAAYRGPVLMISGSNDDISQESALRELAAGLASAPQITIVSGADHFWYGQERPLADAIREFFAAQVPAPNS